MTDVSETRPIMRNVRPFHGRVTVQESELEEETLASGLLVPFNSDASSLKRGVIVEVSGSVLTGAYDDFGGADELQPGMVVYYRSGVKIGDVVVVDVRDIIAYES